MCKKLKLTKIITESISENSPHPSLFFNITQAFLQFIQIVFIAIFFGTVLSIFPPCSTWLFLGFIQICFVNNLRNIMMYKYCILNIRDFPRFGKNNSLVALSLYRQGKESIMAAVGLQMLINSILLILGYGD